MGSAISRKYWHVLTRYSSCIKIALLQKFCSIPEMLMAGLWNNLRCNQEHPHARGDMRIQYPDRPICRYCNSSVYVCVVDTLGHLVCVYGYYYYFCLECSRVHSWRGTGSELGRCPWSREPGATRSVCAFCVRTALLTSVTVFDKKLAIMQKLLLCSKHCPAAPLMASVHDLASLRTLVSHIQ
jgi:hypothetical protein